ncbi:MAG: hypothetical protein FWD57_16920 [Polyangiaceae bacterium]|nr:hypothetical protein [Polyangiaceae bacterium]
MAATNGCGRSKSATDAQKPADSAAEATASSHSGPDGSVGFRTISVGFFYQCALTSTGSAMCWGGDQNGSLGVGKDEGIEVAEPAHVVGLEHGVAAVTVGSTHTCAQTIAGGLKCWGNNNMGQLGDGKEANSTVPVQVAGHESGVSQVSAGDEHTCAVLVGGAVKCWGGQSDGKSRCASGDCGDTSSVPTQIVGLESGAKFVSVGNNYTCVLMIDGGVKCWGVNNDGQLGDGTRIDRQTPEYVSGLGSGVAAIATGDDHACAVTSSGSVKCWGNGRWGAIRDGENVDRFVSTQVVGLESGVRAIAAGLQRSCAITNAGAVKCWGRQTNVGIDEATILGPRWADSSSPVQVPGLESGALSIAARWYACAITAAGTAQCWGCDLDKGDDGKYCRTKVARVPDGR